MRMRIFGLLRPKNTAPVARERLQILLAHERGAVGPRDLVAILREDILATIAKHVALDPAKVKVKVGESGPVSTLEIDVELPAPYVTALDRRASEASRAFRRASSNSA
jgi:cell division topological specificity factor